MNTFESEQMVPLVMYGLVFCRAAISFTNVVYWLLNTSQIRAVLDQTWRKRLLTGLAVIMNLLYTTLIVLVAVEQTHKDWVLPVELGVIVSKGGDANVGTVVVLLDQLTSFQRHRLLGSYAGLQQVTQKHEEQAA